MKAFFKSFSIHTDTENGRDTSTIRVEFINSGSVLELHHFLMFIKEKGILSLDTLKTYVFLQSLKGKD